MHRLDLTATIVDKPRAWTCELCELLESVRLALVEFPELSSPAPIDITPNGKLSRQPLFRRGDAEREARTVTEIDEP